MKSNQRLDYSTLSEVLGQRGLVEPQRLSLALQTCQQAGVPFPETLVFDNLIGDWELAKVVCDIYGLPFLPVDMYAPDAAAIEGMEREFLREHRLVPVGRHGAVLVVAMPGIVQADVLAAIANRHGVRVLPVVGTVLTNNRWLEEFMPAEVAGALPAEGEELAEGGGAWGSIFDEGDAAVLMDLGGDGGEMPFEVEPLPGDPGDELAPG
ncbi:MAG TPA: hypothetical protein VMT18_07935 [Planctomycetota bacterium]|nr:hypothetical protein [Planctomycetota bacterium]